MKLNASIFLENVEKIKPVILSLLNEGFTQQHELMILTLDLLYC